MTKQEMFDNAYNHFRQPGAELGRNYGSQACLYRTRTGGSCAIGCQIPDALYNKAMEGSEISDVLYEYEEIRKLFGIEWTPGEGDGDFSPTDADKIEFLGDLQQAHDESQTVVQFLGVLRGFARERGLTIPV
jgi:hypothetical protein